MTDDSKATPRPWKAVEEAALDYCPSIIATTDGKSRVAVMYGGGPIRAIDKAEERANAALIVAAVNGHDALMAERNRLRQQVEDLEADASNDYGKYLALKHDYDRLRQHLKQDYETLARAEAVLYRDGCKKMREEVVVALARIREVLDNDDLEEGKK